VSPTTRSTNLRASLPACLRACVLACLPGWLPGCAYPWLCQCAHQCDIDSDDIMGLHYACCRDIGTKHTRYRSHARKIFRALGVESSGIKLSFIAGGGSLPLPPGEESSPSGRAAAAAAIGRGSEVAVAGFAHIDGRGRPHYYPAETCELIAAAIVEGVERVRLPDVPRPASKGGGVWCVLLSHKTVNDVECSVCQVKLWTSSDQSTRQF
jgi:hypothetical protein